MNKKGFNTIFILSAVVIFFVMLFHFNGIFYPSAVSPAWRHAFFVLINLICLYGLLKRPGWFIWFIAILTIQQWYSHGAYAIHIWRTQHIIHWISVADILLLPILLILLVTDK